MDQQPSPSVRQRRTRGKRARAYEGTSPDPNAGWDAFRHDFIHHIRQKLLEVSVLCLIVVADPFGFESATLEASRTVRDRITAALHHPSAAPHLAVVLIDDDMLALWNRDTPPDDGFGWPPALEQREILLETVLAHRPAAVFVDVALSTRRGTAGELARLAATISQEGTAARAPVILGDLGAAARASQARAPACDNGATPGRTSLLAPLACAADRVVWFDLPLSEADRRSYPFHVTVEIGGEAVERPAPAVALLAAAHPRLCGEWRVGLPGCDAWPGGEVGEAGRGLVPRWSLWGPRELTGTPLPASRSEEIVLRQSCVAERASPWDPQRLFTAYVRIPLASLFGNAPTLAAHVAGVDLWSGAARAPCNPVVTIHSAALMRSGAARNPLLHQVLRDRAVMIGAGYSGSADLVVSPLHGPIPGVFLHAVALENLLTLGRRFDAEPDKARLGPFSVLQGKLVDWGLKAAGIVVAIGLVLLIRDLVLSIRAEARLSGPAPAPRGGYVHFGAPARLLCRRFALETGSPAAREAALARLESRLRWGGRMLVCALLIGGLLVAGEIGIPSANWIAVIIVGFAFAFPILEPLPLASPHPDSLTAAALGHHHDGDSSRPFRSRDGLSSRSPRPARRRAPRRSRRRSDRASSSRIMPRAKCASCAPTEADGTGVRAGPCRRRRSRSWRGAPMSGSRSRLTARAFACTSSMCGSTTASPLAPARPARRARRRSSAPWASAAAISAW